MENNERNNHCPISGVCPNNFNCKFCSLNDYTPENEKDKTILAAAVNRDKTYHEWFNLVGLSDVMPNGHDIYLDCEELDCAENALLHYDMNTHTYHCETTDDKEYYITEEEVEKSKVTYIGSSTEDISVASIWIKPTEEWFKNNPELSGEGL